MVAVSVAVAGLWLSVSQSTGAVEHPRLVSIEATDCSLCHDDVTDKPGEQHAPAVDDCTSCHQFSIGEGGTEVSLMDADPALCVLCHDDLTAAAEVELAAPHFPVADGCLNCHDPHASEHEKLLKAELSSLCADCHDLGEVDGAHGIPVSRADCRSCHDPHGSEVERMLAGTHPHPPFADGSCLGCHKRPRGTKVRLRAEGGDLCFACHADQRDQATGEGVHSVVRQGRCVECHDPHLSDHPYSLAAAGEALCFTCHPAIQAKADGEGAHVAVESGCDTCHEAHRSSHAALLSESPIDTCLLCHDAEDEELVGRHLGADLADVACTSCHDPHGSEASPLLASGSIHPPFQDDCGTCHEGAADQLMEGGGAELCAFCHDDVQEAAQEAAVPHLAMELGECTVCHSPHASAQEKLLAGPGGAPCADCHDDKLASGDQFSHQAIEWLGCHSCHQPHGGDNEKLLKASADEMCRGCHLASGVRRADDGSVTLPGGQRLEGERAVALRLVDLDAEGRGHPLPGHPVSGKIEGGGRSELAPEVVGSEMGCVSCHDPHVGSNRKLFANQAPDQYSLCSECHLK